MDIKAPSANQPLHRGLIALVLLLGLVMARQTPAQVYQQQPGPWQEQPAQQYPVPDEEILRFVPGTTPLREYDSWSIFLVCNPKWIYYEDEAVLQNLHKVFEAFGNAIGRYNLAVWFTKDENYRDSLPTIDYSTAAEYCSKYKLTPGDAPHVLVTTSYPSIWMETPADHLAVKLGGIDDAQIIELITELTNQVLVTGLQQQKIDSKYYWLSWYSIINDVLEAFSTWSHKIAFTIKTGFFDVTFRGIEVQ